MIHRPAGCLPLVIDEGCPSGFCFILYQHVFSSISFASWNFRVERDLQIMSSIPIFRNEETRPTKESDLPNITQSGSGERTFLLAFKRNHCSPGGLESVTTDAALLRALKGGEAWGQSILSFSPPLKCTDHQYIILKNMLHIISWLRLKHTFLLFL